MKAIILYYSRSGITEKLAKRIKNELDCDILKVEVEDTYGNYLSSCVRVIKENLSKTPPKVSTGIPNLDTYNIVLLGYPVWAQDVPSFFAEFVERCDLQGKTVVPFATFGGTGISWTMKTIKRICPESNVTLPFNYGLVKKDNFNEWISSVIKLNDNL